AKLIQSFCKRDTDMMTRIGEKEFLLLFNDEDQHQHRSTGI
ncbi:MAG: PleD family two-component response regulator, partial [Paraglaciecola sp.]